jgi:hypothetical protein
VRPATSPEEKLRWTLKALRTDRSGNTAVVANCCRAVPRLAAFMDDSGLLNTDLAHDLAREIVAKTAEAEMTNPQAHDPSANVHKELHHPKVRRKVCARVAFSAATETTGGPPLTGADAAASLRAYRAPIFQAKETDGAAEDQLLRHIPMDQLCPLTGHGESFAYEFL